VRWEARGVDLLSPEIASGHPPNCFGSPHGDYKSPLTSAAHELAHERDAETWRRGRDMTKAQYGAYVERINQSTKVSGQITAEALEWEDRTYAYRLY
jgi:hypothetical protein